MTTMTRRLRLADAVAIGVGSMVGAGVFAVWGPATHAAGSLLLLALVVAAAVALCNATSSAQLAAQFPVSGGSYVYGRELLGPWLGYAAGWCFVIGKTASCAAMALTLAAHLVPGDGRSLLGRLVAVAAVLVLTTVNCLGVTRTAALTKVIITIVLVVLVTTAVVTTLSPANAATAPLGLAAGVGGVLQAAALLFFAFAGYARIATMGEEVVEPDRTIPRAIIISLTVTLLVYAVVASVVIVVLGGAVVGSAEPIGDLARATGHPWLLVPIGVAAALATTGALLNLMTGIGRTSLAMAREGDLPGWLSALHPSSEVPYRAEICLGVVVSVLVLTLDLRSAIGFSSFGVLLYYAVANLSALRQPSTWRRWPRLVPVVGLVGCVVLVVTLPGRVVLAGIAVLAAGIVVRVVSRRGRRRGAPLID